MTLVLGGLIWFVVRDRPEEKGYPGFTPQGSESTPVSGDRIWQGLLTVLRYRNTWLLFFIPGGIVGCILTFSGLWGVPYLISHHHLSPTRAAALSSVLLIGWALGGPFFGWLSDWMGRRKPLYIAGCMVLALGWSLILFRQNLSYFHLTMILSVTGFCSGSMILSFAFVSESVPSSLSGTVSGLINMGVMMGPMLLQPIVGKILDHHWTGGMASGVRVYSLDAYEYGFIPMMGWVILSVLLLFFTKETRCCQTA
jgi:MFS family permease